MKFLVLDDDAIRHEHFNDLEGDVTHVWNVEQAVEALKREKFDVVFLDRDLGLIDKGTGNELTGQDVVRFMIEEMDKTLYPKKVIIHSWNIEKAFWMEQDLRNHGFNVSRAPFRSPVHFDASTVKSS